MYGLSRQVSDLNQAVALLGTKPLKLLVLGFSLSEALFSKLTGVIVARYWRRSLTKAIAARELSEGVWHIPGDEAFIAGLLQDIGQLALVQELGQPYVALLERVDESDGELLASERRALGFDHRELSAALLARWRLPPALVAAVSPDESGQREAPSEAQRSLAERLHLANLLTDLVVGARLAALGKLLDGADGHRRLTQEQVAQLVARLQERLRELADIFSVKLPPGADYRDVLIEAQRRMARVGEEVAIEGAGRAKPVAAKDTQQELVADLRDLTAQMNAFLRHEPTGNGPRQTETPCEHASESIAAPAARATQTAVALDDSLRAVLESAIGYCRQRRCALSLLLVEIDSFDQLSTTLGPIQAEAAVTRLREACGRLDLPRGVRLPVAAARLALVLPEYERSQAVQLASQLVRTAGSYLNSGRSDAAGAVTVSAGVATAGLPPKNGRPEDLAEAAARCLSAAQLSGGNTLKSISVY
jgi:HD-like signal output (HDOD) protein